MLFREIGVVRLVGLVQMPMRRPHAHPIFYQPKLITLKPRGGIEQITKLQEIQRRHRLQNPDLGQQQLLDFGNAREAMHGNVHLAFIHRVRMERLNHCVQLKQDLFEPQLVGLMDHDEEHLVMRRPAVFLAFTLLARKELIELQVRTVVQRFRGFHAVPKDDDRRRDDVGNQKSWKKARTCKTI